MLRVGQAAAQVSVKTPVGAITLRYESIFPRNDCAAVGSAVDGRMGGPALPLVVWHARSGGNPLARRRVYKSGFQDAGSLKNRSANAIAQENGATGR